MDLGSFGESTRLLERLTGLVVSAEAVRQKTEGIGLEIEGEAQQRAMRTVLRTREPAQPLDLAPGRIVIETDGVMVGYLDGFHEVKLGLVAGQKEDKLVCPSDLALRASPEEFGPRLISEAARRGALEVVGWKGGIIGKGLAVLPEVVFLGDGAPWIWSLAEATLVKGSRSLTTTTQASISGAWPTPSTARTQRKPGLGQNVSVIVC